MLSSRASWQICKGLRAASLDKEEPGQTLRKGFEQRSKREFGQYAEHEIGQKGAPQQPLGLRHEHIWDFSGSV